jgi:hypothetical protein
MRTPASAIEPSVNKAVLLCRVLAATLCWLVGLALAPQIASAVPPAGPTATRLANGLLRWNGVRNPRVIDNTLGLYLAWQTSPLSRSPIDELALVNRTTGAVGAERSLQGSFQALAVADNSLYVETSSTSGDQYLLRLEPRTLKVMHTWLLAHHRAQLSLGSIALVGGDLWVSGGDRLLRLSPRSGHIAASIVAKGVVGWQVGNDPSGSALIVSAQGPLGLGRVQ